MLRGRVKLYSRVYIRLAINEISTAVHHQKRRSNRMRSAHSPGLTYSDDAYATHVRSIFPHVQTACLIMTIDHDSLTVYDTELVVITVPESVKHIVVPDTAVRPGRSPKVIRQREDDVHSLPRKSIVFHYSMVP